MPRWCADSWTAGRLIRLPPHLSMGKAQDKPSLSKLNAVEQSLRWPSVRRDHSETERATPLRSLALFAQVRNSRSLPYEQILLLVFHHNLMFCNHLNLLDFTGSLEARLVNGKDDCSGRVEVRHGDVWNTVCDTDWTLNKAEVVCDMLECGRAVNAPGGVTFGQSSGPVVESRGSCFDNITSLKQCSLNGFRTGTCGHEHSAGVVCAGKAFQIKTNVSVVRWDH